ncbi:pyrroline-5-carboxylate reductase [Candidatus Desantisbacteria bacterium]|nr:pyrroline-5-carboxylate reductase [Candidatus Desantisbacteria bacterium]
MINKKNILFIGAGNMAEAIISGLISAKVYNSDQINAYDIDKSRLEFIKSKFKIITYNNLKSAVSESNILLLAVKPQTIIFILNEICPYYKDEQLIISIVAGINSSIIVKYLGENARIIRVMPNTPALVKAGMSVICKAGKAKEEDIEEARKIFSALGEIEVLSELYFNAVTALSGSGPAYVFLMIEALMEAGIKVGLNRDIALKLAMQTVYGSVKMIKKTNLHPAELKNKVCSPGGTTIAALYKLEKGAFRALITEAVEEAFCRAIEMEKNNC